MHAESSGPGDDSIRELLIEQLRDILHAEKQLTKALPKMARPVRPSSSICSKPTLGKPRLRQKDSMNACAC
jgi:Domain of unknown function (DUF892)